MILLQVATESVSKVDLIYWAIVILIVVAVSIYRRHNSQKKDGIDNNGVVSNDTKNSIPPADNSVIISVKPTKRCPFCGEEILAKAKKCRHCFSFLNSELSNSNNK